MALNRSGTEFKNSCFLQRAKALENYFKKLRISTKSLLCLGYANKDKKAGILNLLIAVSVFQIFLVAVPVKIDGIGLLCGCYHKIINADMNGKRGAIKNDICNISSCKWL